uniref:Coiled-coil domain-containing protein 124 n=1 Tax=Schistosoma japonicum TaxID=6182 RepID=C1LHG8_SCHJA|nr:Coiled-coil domain-containing protein 124 [Schistosoma japonicum]
MPKKLGTCPKSLEARERRAEKKREERELSLKKAEEEYWKDDDKYSNRKQQRKEEKDSKRQELMEKKKEKEKLYNEEIASFKSAKSTVTKEQPSKLTQTQIAEARRKLEAQLLALNQTSQKSEPPELAPNPNRIETDELEARTVKDAISILSVNNEGDGDRHPEKRLKAAYQAFEERMMPHLKAENPSMRHSQLKQLLFKMFQTSPENPKNHQNACYNSK